MMFRIMSLIPLSNSIYNNMNIIITESQYKRLISENFQQEKEMILDLLKDYDFDHVIRFEFTKDDDIDRVGSVFLVFDIDLLYKLDFHLRDKVINVTKNKIEGIIKKYLGLKNIYVGSYFERRESL